MRARARSGFTLIELVVAIVLMVVVAVAVVGTGRIVTASVQRASLELRAAQLVEAEVQRLRTLPLADLVDGTAVRPGGVSTWTVTDSGAYLRVEVALATTPLAGVSLADTVFVYRAP